MLMPCDALDCVSSGISIRWVMDQVGDSLCASNTLGLCSWQSVVGSCSVTDSHTVLVNVNDVGRIAAYKVRSIRSIRSYECGLFHRRLGNVLQLELWP